MFTHRCHHTAQITVMFTGLPWKWMDGCQGTGYENWSPGEPNEHEGGDEDCTEAGEKWAGKWNDDLCHEDTPWGQKPFVCKMRCKCDTFSTVN